MWIVFGFLSIAFHILLIFSGLVPNLISRPLHLALILPWVFLYNQKTDLYLFINIAIVLIGIFSCFYIAIFSNELMSQAEKLKLRLGLEPIGSWEILKKGHLNSIAICQKLIKNSNHKLIIDLYHSFEDLDLDKFLKKSPHLGLLQFSNINFDKNFRPVGRKTINNENNIKNIDVAKYLKILFNRKDNLKIEFEIFRKDYTENPQSIILNIKKELLNIL